MKKLLAAALCATFMMTPAFAQFPEKPVTVIYPNKAGGNFYTVALAIANEISEDIGQPITIQPMPGAATSSGTRFAADQPADGYTLEFIHEGAMQASLLGMLGFDLRDKMEPIVIVMQLTPALYTLADSPFNNLQELADYAGANPGAVKFAINTGSSAHVSMAAMAGTLGISDDVRLVHTGGGGAGFQQALLSGDVNVIQANPALMKDMVSTGKVKALAFTGAERHPLLPDTLTMDEQGFDTPASVINTGFFWIAKDTPDDIKKFWVDELRTLLTNEEEVAALEKKLNVDLVFITGDELDQIVNDSYAERESYLEKLGLLNN